MSLQSLGKTNKNTTGTDHPEQRRSAIASPAAKSAFDAAVDYLNRRAEKGKLARSGPDDRPMFERIAKSNIRQASPVEKSLASSQAGVLYMSGNSGAYALKASACLAKSGKGLSLGLEADALGSTMDMEASGAGVLFGGVGLAANAVKLKNTRDKKKGAIDAMAKNLEKARLHVERPDCANADTAASYRQFMEASKSVVHKNKDKWIEESSDSNLLQHQNGATVARYAMNTSSSVVNLVGAGASTVASTPVGPFLSVGVGAAEMAAASVTLESGRRKSRSLRGKLAAIESWRYQRKNAGLNLPVVAIAEACRGEMRRQERLANWVKRGAKVQFAKATGNVTLGLAGGVLAAVGVATVLGAAAITAGIAVAVVGAFLSAAYLGYTAVRSVRNARSERHCVRRQKQAQGLIATHSRAELQRLMGEADTQLRKATAITVQRGGFLNTGRRTLQVETVDAGRNAYVGLHLMAQELADMVGNGKRGNRLPAEAVLAFLETPDDPQQCDQYVTREQGAILRLLQSSGMSAFDIHSLCMAAGGISGEDQLCYLKQAIAGAIGLPFRLGSNGREKSLTPFAYLAPVQDLMATPSFAANVKSGKADQITAAGALFGQVDFYAFAIAMADPALPVAADGSVAQVARKLLAVEKDRRQLLLSTLGKDDEKTKKVLLTDGGFDDMAVADLFAFLSKHASEMSAGPEHARNHLNGEKAASWLQQWRAAEARGVLPDRPWVRLVCEMASRI